MLLHNTKNKELKNKCKQNLNFGLRNVVLSNIVQPYFDETLILDNNKLE